MSRLLGAAARRAVTPAMRQWAELKAQHPEHLLFFQVGDFFECLHEDAEEASSLLNIALTSRVSKTGRIPMAGVPLHAVQGYLSRLKALGRTVALAEQRETPEEARAAGRRVVARQITRIITPATCVDEELLDLDRVVYLAALSRLSKSGDDDSSSKCSYRLVWSDVAAGNGGHRTVPDLPALVDLLASLAPQEVLVLQEDLLTELPAVVRNCRLIFSPQTSCEDAIADYLKINSVGNRSEMVTLPEEPSFRYLSADAGTRFALDLFSSSTSQSVVGSLLNIFTSSGHRFQTASLRLLRTRLSNPLHPSEREEILSRLSAVDGMMKNPDRLRELRTLLTRTPMYGDAERALQRIALAVHRTPLHLARDLRSVCLAMQLASTLASQVNAQVKRWSSLALSTQGELRRVTEKILALVGTEDGDADALGIVPGADAILDRLRDERAVKQDMDAMEREICEMVGAPVKVSRGRSADEIYFAVTEKYGEVVSRISRENLAIRYVGQRANSTRWSTDALEQLGRRIATRERDAIRRTETILQQCRLELLKHAADAKHILNAIYDLDLSIGVASAAVSMGLAIPGSIDAECRLLHLDGLFHPVIRHVQKEDVTRNNVVMGADSRVLVVTGANMSGKSSLIRAVALASWCTQSGLPSAVEPSSVIPLFDTIFVRVGSSDDVVHDRSSFLNEMMGVSSILQKTSDSSMLCCLDELGRSTAPDDGTAICAALIRELGKRPSVMTLLSTHFPLSKFADKGLLPNTRVCHLEVITMGDDHIFTHKLCNGNAQSSLAFHVARVAGVPGSLLDDAQLMKARLKD